LLLATLFVYGQSAEDLKRLEEFRRKVNAPVVLAKDDRIKVKITKDLVYNTAKDTSQKMDVYQPVSGIKKEKLPLVVFIHGKTPIQTNPKNWGGYKSWGELAASRGYVAIVFTQSLGTPGRSIEEAGTDLQDALKYIKANHSHYNIDTNRIALLAYSAGVPLLSGALLHNKESIKCLAAFYGFMDMRNIEMWKSESQETLSKFSLVDYLNANIEFPPIFIARAGREHNKGLNETIDSFIAKANNANINVTVINHTSGVHGFDTQNDDDRSREIIESVFTFLKYHLKK
ncbi:MAG TPA: alpha/beta hydrolase, partial [Sphingobacteriaceae bacterium]